MGTLIGWFGNDCPMHEYMTDEELMMLCMKQLSLVFDNNDISLEKPTSYHVTRWQDDPYTCGSYSYVPVGSSLDDMKVLGESINDKIYFAGEATNPMYFGTTHWCFFIW